MNRVPFGWAIVVNAVALFLMSSFLNPYVVINMSDTHNVLQRVGIYLVIGFFLALVTAIVKPIVQLISLPFIILTLGLFTLVVNALMLMLVAWSKTLHQVH
jgi:putative membrane protein